MSGETNYNIVVTQNDVCVIRSFLQTLMDCPFPLTDDDFVSVMRNIADGDSDTESDVDGITIEYSEEEK